ARPRPDRGRDAADAEGGARPAGRGDARLHPRAGGSMPDSDRDVRRTVYDGDGRTYRERQPPRGGRGRGRPPAGGLSAQARRLFVVVLLIAAVAGLVRAGGWVLSHHSSNASAP